MHHACAGGGAAAGLGTGVGHPPVWR